MSYIDARGALQDFDVAASVGIYRNYTAYTEAGSVYDLTNGTVTTVIKDDRESPANYGGEYATLESVSQSITDAVNGEFDFEIAASVFTNREGGRLSHETYFTNPSGKKIGLMWGYINVLERG
jgi:hypothetical protein